MIGWHRYVECVIGTIRRECPRNPPAGFRDSTGIGSARGIAKAYGVFASGGRELGLRPETIEALICTGYADPEFGLGYGYVTNRMGTHLQGDPRDIALRAAIPTLARSAKWRGAGIAKPTEAELAH